MISCTEHLLIRVGERNPELLRPQASIPALPRFPIPIGGFYHYQTDPYSSPFLSLSLCSGLGSFGVCLLILFSLALAPKSVGPQGASPACCLAAARSSRTCGEASRSVPVTGHLALFLGTSLGRGGAYYLGSSLLFSVGFHPARCITGPVQKAFDIAIPATSTSHKDFDVIARSFVSVAQ